MEKYFIFGIIIIYVHRALWRMFPRQLLRPTSYARLEPEHLENLHLRLVGGSFEGLVSNMSRTLAFFSSVAGLAILH
jgi:hypothetical protein